MGPKPTADGRDAQMKMPHKKCDAHLAVNNAEALLNMRKEDLFL